MYPTQVRQLPDETFYAILRPESVTVPGDERSRQCPGHGYPEHTVHHWSMQVFASREAWASEVERMGQDGKDFKAVKVTPARVTRSVRVDIETQD